MEGSNWLIIIWVFREEKEDVPAYTPEHVVLLTKCEQANGEGLSATTQMSLDEDVLVSSGFNT